MQKSKNAFTVIEMVFVIVVLGILAAVAIPRFAATRTDAEITKGRADIASIRSAIVSERQARLIVGCPSYIPNGTGTYTCNSQTYKQLDNGGLFGGVLMYPEVNKVANGNWSATAGSGTYQFRVQNTNTQFSYDPTDGTFTCTAGSNFCDDLVN
ncbi:type II secretion system protein [Sulfurimonas sp.]|uniref:type II secretion system protein n=1 Tax=Sulfurimonas sp. TaxID=2022749 RepID=UPI0035641EB1